MTEGPKAFALDAAEGVVVYVDDSSDDETFAIAVLQEGAEVEQHQAVTADSVGALQSEYFSVEYISPPAPESE